jgi:sec-independent protein translocase protein TatC
MPTGLRPIGHEDKLTLVDHLTELRKRLLISAFTLVAAFSFCFWQNNAILDIVTKPVRDTQNLQDPSSASKDPLEQAARFQIETGQAFKVLAPALGSTGKTFRSLQGADNLTAAQRASIAISAQQLALASKEFAQAAAARPTSTQRNLVTLGVTEPFTATITIAFYASLLLAMPMLLFQAYAFVLPAFSPGERKVALPLMLMVPVLFIMGAAFGYFVVLERAVSFLQNFNDDSFDILLQAKDYFKFAVLFVAGVGVLFQIPVGVLAVTRLGIFTPKQLAKNRGYVILAIAVLAAVATPTPDPFTMSLAMFPLIILFELSILLARWLERIKPPSEGSSRWDFDDDDDDEQGLPLDEPDDDEEDLPEGADRFDIAGAADDVAAAAADDQTADDGPRHEPGGHDDDPSKLEGPDRKD